MTTPEIAAVDWIAAYHESAHAVAGLLYGARVRSVTAAPVLAGDAGRAILFGLAEDDPRAAVVDLAGAAAVAHYAASGGEVYRQDGHALPYIGAAGDIARAVAVRLRINDADTLASSSVRSIVESAAGQLAVVEREASELVAKFWTEIERGAEALLEAPLRTMTGAEFARAAGGRVAWYAEEEPAAVATADPVYADVATCPTCGRRAFLPMPAAVALTQEERAAWAAAQLAAVCRHDLAGGAHPLGVDDGRI